MTTTPAAASTDHRFPAEIIAYAVWLTFRFPLSYRPVAEILVACGIVVSDEAIREWCRKFRQTYANALQWRRAQPGDQSGTSMKSSSLQRPAALPLARRGSAREHLGYWGHLAAG